VVGPSYIFGCMGGDLTPIVLVRMTIMGRIKTIAILALLSLLFLYSFSAEGNNNDEDTDAIRIWEDLLFAKQNSGQHQGRISQEGL